MVSARRARRPPQSKSKAWLVCVALAPRMALVSAHELRDVPLTVSVIIMSVANLTTRGAPFAPLTQTLG